MRQVTGCQVIVNGLHRSLWYYLRLVSDASAVLANYSQQLTSDQDIHPDHRELWNKILGELMERVTKLPERGV